MDGLREQDLRAALQVLRAVSAAGADWQSYAHAGVAALPTLVASEITTLSVCHLRSGHRSVIGSPDGRLSTQDRACFDRHFDEHPLVRFHAHQRGQGAHRISDSLPFARFRHTPLYSDYYRRIGIDHVVALPIQVDDDTLVSFVLNRSRRDFSDRDCAALELVREPLAQMYRQARAVERAQAALAGLIACLDTPGPPGRSTRFDALPLTAREREVMHWLATGKTDREIAALLGCSHRTVQKHLEHAYEKLGVETRTAAVMRALDTSLH